MARAARRNQSGYLGDDSRCKVTADGLNPIVVSPQETGRYLIVSFLKWSAAGMAEMEKTEEVPLRDTCDTMLTNVKSREINERQRRFLEAYQQNPTIARAAKLAGVHRATVYRWLAEPAFADALKRARDAFYIEHLAKVKANVAARQAWRDERERQRRPMRCHYLALARKAKYG